MRLRLPGSPVGITGFSGDMAPGSVASVASSNEVAFRAEFPDGNRPARADLYWRGAVLWQGDGLNWQVGPGIGRARVAEQSTAPRIRQRITIEPHAGRWLFALDRPLEAPAGAWLVPGRYLHSIRPISSIRRYDVVSAADGGEDDLHPRERTAALQPPSAASPRCSSWCNRGRRAPNPRARSSSRRWNFSARKASSIHSRRRIHRPGCARRFVVPPQDRLL
jgi:hypothetical protein